MPDYDYPIHSGSLQMKMGFILTIAVVMRVFFMIKQLSKPGFYPSIQFGTVFSAGKKISIDVFAGTGARFINTAFANMENPISGVRVKEDGPSIIASYSYEGKS